MTDSAVPPGSGTAAELARLQQSIELLRKEAELIRKLSRASNVDDLLEDILLHIRERWGFDTVGIQLMDETHQLLRGYRTHGVVLDEQARAHVAVDVPLDPRASVSAWVALRQQAVYAHPERSRGTRPSEIDRQAARALGLVESFIVPIVADGKTLGVVHFGVRRQRPPLSDSQLAEVREFMLGMTAPIRGVVIREALENSRREQAELAWLCRQISANIELKPLLQLLGEQVLAGGLFDGYLVGLPDAAESALACRHIQLPAEFAGMESAYAELREPLDGKDPLAVAYRTATTVQVTAAELAQWPPSLRNRFQRWRIHTAVAMPIRLGERAAGVVFAFRQRPGLNAERLQMLEQRLPLFAEQIRNALFYTDLRRREAEIVHATAEQQRFLDLANRLIELTDTEQIYRLITDDLLSWLPFDMAGVVLREQDRLVVKRIGVRDSTLEPLQRAWQDFYRERRFRLDPAEGATAFAYVHDSRVLIPDVSQVLHLPMSKMDREALALMESPRTFLFVPIRRRREAVGVLWLISVRQTVELPEPDISLIEALCAVIGTAIGNAELYATVESQRREIEAALDELRRTQHQLADAKAAAEASAAAKSVFVANTSHEIRTPLTAIIGFAEMLVEQAGSDSEVGRSAAAILRNGRHLLGLINDILDISKIEAGRLAFDRIAFAPAELLRDVVAAMTLLAGEKGLYFRVSASTPIPERIIGDPARVRQALFNLCNNAVKFTQAGGVEVTVDCDPAAQRLRIRVQDTGIGIREEDKAKLFQPFAQVEDPRSRRYAGTGLGLAITRQLVEGMGGTIGVSSAVGVGSVFELTLPTGPLQGVPMQQPRFDAALPAGAEPAMPAPAAVRLTGRVLVADDSADNRLLIQHYLEQLGLQPVLVEDGEQAVAAALADSFDLVILDIQMPGMSGLDALAALRDCGFPKPVVALTANVMSADVQHYLQAGFDACLGKPIDRRRFGETLQRFLPRAAVSDAVKPADIAVLARRFAQDLPGRLALLDESLRARDWQQMAAEAHKLKGTAGVLGWPGVGAQADRIETLIRTMPDSPTRRQALAEALQRALDLVSSPPSA